MRFRGLPIQSLEPDRGAGYQASLFDGDTQFIFDIILDVGADPSVRFWQWHALTLIGLEGNLDRTVAADFARQAFGRLSTGEGESLIWAGWEKLISRLALTELAPLVRKAHDADLLVESTYEVSTDLEYAVAHPTPLVPSRWLASESWSRGWRLPRLLGPMCA